MEYEKSYKGFVIWMLVFIAAVFACAFIPIEDSNLMTLIVDNIMTVGMAILTWIIYRNEKIYWYSGLSYEDAKKVSSEQRKKYAFEHFKRFAIFAGIYFVYSIAAYIFSLPVGVHIAVVLIGIVVTAVSTMSIRLER